MGHNLPILKPRPHTSNSLISGGHLDSEDRILHWVRCIVEEAWAVVDFEDEEPEFRGDPRDLSFAVLKIWARLFKGNSQWRFINMIGLSLEKYREMLIRATDDRRAEQQVF